MSLVKATFENQSGFSLASDCSFDIASYSPWLNLATLIMYLIGLASCGLLTLVSLFERSGLAGPYRTVFNRLVSYQIDQVSSLQNIIIHPISKIQ